MTDQTVIAGSAPAMSVTYSASTNRRTGECADANGNIGSAPCALGYTYDIENRLTQINSAGYSYAPGNKRLYRKVGSNEELTYYGISGQKIATYSMTFVSNTLTLTRTGTWWYFGGKLVKNAGGYVGQDRIGSVGNKFFPYGQERNATSNDKEKFATYYRDAESGLDYAVNRFHSPGQGRFLTSDPYKASVGAADPGSWNRYAYVGGDPINYNDPRGLYACIAGYGADGAPDWTECQDESTYVPGTNPNAGCATVTSPEDPAWQQCFGPPPSTQGTGAAKTINVSNYQTTDKDKKAKQVQNALSDLKALLPNDPTCDHWLKNNGFVIDLVLGKNPDVKFQTGVGNFSDPTVNAVFGNTGTNLPTSAGITVNANGAFFSSSVTVGYGVTGMTGGTATAQAFILLHELAHAVGAAGFLDGDSDPTGQAANNALVLENCAQTINSFGKKP